MNLEVAPNQDLSSLLAFSTETKDKSVVDQENRTLSQHAMNPYQKSKG